MKIRPYLTYPGTCEEALELYQRAFATNTLELARFSDLPPSPEAPLPQEFAEKILQATLKIGDDFIRLSDCWPGEQLNDPESERISLAIEAHEDEVRKAFNVLAEEGHVGIPLQQTFFSPCHGVVFDKFGVMWNFIAISTPQ